MDDKTSPPPSQNSAPPPSDSSQSQKESYTKHDTVGGTLSNFSALLSKKGVLGLVVVVLIIGIGATVIASQRSTEYRQKAVGSLTPTPSYTVPINVLVINDVNGDGRYSGIQEAPINRATVVLNDGTSATTVNGVASFRKPAGRYSASLRIPAGYKLSPGSVNPALVDSSNSYSPLIGIQKIGAVAPTPTRIGVTLAPKPSGYYPTPTKNPSPSYYPSVSKVPAPSGYSNGSVCTYGSQCQSGICKSGVCSATY